MRKSYIFGIAIAALLSSCSKDTTYSEGQLDVSLKQRINTISPTGNYDYYSLPSKDDLDAIPQDPRNPLTAAKVELGKMIFFDTGLAQDAIFPSGVGTYSCASCHLPTAGFRPGAPQGVADGGRGFGVNGESRLKNSDYDESQLDVQSARPLSLINVAFVTNTFWNGQFGSRGANIGTEDVWHLREDTELNELGFEAIETQNIEGIKTHRIKIDKEILDDFGYTAMFDEVFPDLPEDERYTQFSASLALSAYIRTILGDQAPFQDWLRGDSDALTAQEKEGASLFFGKARCATCHYEQNLGSTEFHALGVKDMYQRPSFNTSADDRRNLGRGGFTLVEEDNYRFKVPGLYNVGDAPFFFHGASKNTLEDVLDYKIAAETENVNVSQDLLSPDFQALDLTSSERQALLAFIRDGLRDPNLTRHAPTSVPSGNCFPNNDYDSRVDLGCD
ncbi:MAG: cytochrome c peroxidase [Bacteroidota bacterium]